MPPPTTTFAWPTVARRLFRKPTARLVGRQATTFASPLRPMCSLSPIADVARRAARRNQTPSTASPLLLSSLLSRGSKSAPYLSDSELDNLVSLVGNVTAEDLGLFKEDFVGETEICYVCVANTPEVSMAVFVLPPGSAIPLHDHVGMFVVSQVLWGRLEVREFDVLPAKGSVANGKSKGRLAIAKPSSFTGKGEVRKLTPAKGNIHSFHTKEWTAVFDVLVPPYNAAQGRDCSYYSALPLNEDKKGGSHQSKGGEGHKVLLQEIECPDTYGTVNVPYQGQRLT